MEAILEKKPPKMTGRWTSRLFRLKDRRLMYFKKDVIDFNLAIEASAKFILDLTHLTSLTIDKKSENVLIIRHPMLDLALRFKTNQLFLSWLKVLSSFTYNRFAGPKIETSIPSNYSYAIWNVLQSLYTHNSLISTEGLFRIAGNKKNKKYIFNNLLNKTYDINKLINHADIHILTNLLSLLLSNLPSTIFLEKEISNLIKWFNDNITVKYKSNLNKMDIFQSNIAHATATTHVDDEVKQINDSDIQLLRNKINELYLNNNNTSNSNRYGIMTLIFHLLKQIIINESTTKMTAESLSRIFVDILESRIFLMKVTDPMKMFRMKYLIKTLIYHSYEIYPEQEWKIKDIVIPDKCEIATINLYNQFCKLRNKNKSVQWRQKWIRTKKKNKIKNVSKKNVFSNDINNDTKFITHFKNPSDGLQLIKKAQKEKNQNTNTNGDKSATPPATILAMSTTTKTKGNVNAQVNTPRSNQLRHLNMKKLSRLKLKPHHSTASPSTNKSKYNKPSPRQLVSAGYQSDGNSNDDDTDDDDKFMDIDGNIIVNNSSSGTSSGSSSPSVSESVSNSVVDNIRNKRRGSLPTNATDSAKDVLSNVQKAPKKMTLKEAQSNFVKTRKSKTDVLPHDDDKPKPKPGKHKRNQSTSSIDLFASGAGKVKDKDVDDDDDGKDETDYFPPIITATKSPKNIEQIMKLDLIIDVDNDAVDKQKFNQMIHERQRSKSKNKVQFSISINDDNNHIIDDDDDDDMELVIFDDHDDIPGPQYSGKQHLNDGNKLTSVHITRNRSNSTPNRSRLGTDDLNFNNINYHNDDYNDDVMQDMIYLNAESNRSTLINVDNILDDDIAPCDPLDINEFVNTTLKAINRVQSAYIVDNDNDDNNLNANNDNGATPTRSANIRTFIKKNNIKGVNNNDKRVTDPLNRSSILPHSAKVTPRRNRGKYNYSPHDQNDYNKVLLTMSSNHSNYNNIDNQIPIPQQNAVINTSFNHNKKDPDPDPVPDADDNKTYNNLDYDNNPISPASTLDYDALLEQVDNMSYDDDDDDDNSLIYVYDDNGVDKQITVCGHKPPVPASQNIVVNNSNANANINPYHDQPPPVTDIQALTSTDAIAHDHEWLNSVFDELHDDDDDDDDSID